MKKVLLTALMGLALGTSAMAATINVGTEATFAPFEFKDPKTNEIVGFDIDMIRAIAKVNGDDIKIINMGFDALIPSLQTRQIDVAVAAMTITPERQARLLFSEPYHDVGLVMLINKKHEKEITDLNALSGKTICAQIGTTGAMLGKTVKGAQVKEFNSIVEAFMELKNGGCHTVLNDRQVVENYMSIRKDDTMTILPHVYEPEQYGMAVHKRNKKLADKINHGLKTIKANGEYAKIYEKWFGAQK